MPQILSRGPDIDMEKCRSMINGNQFDMALLAAQRLRELKAQSRQQNGRYMTAVDALFEVQNGQINVADYTRKIK
jgi:hypothetical protein